IEPHQFGRELGETVIASSGEAILDGNGAALDPAELVKPLHKSSGPLCLRRSRTCTEETDGRQLTGRLSLRRERPSRRCIGKNTEKFAPPHVLSRTSMCGI